MHAVFCLFVHSCRKRRKDSRTLVFNEIGNAKTLYLCTPTVYKVTNVDGAFASAALVIGALRSCRIFPRAVYFVLHGSYRDARVAEARERERENEIEARNGVT